jgi:dCTP deaminase
VRTGREIVALESIQDNQFQPASLDLRLGAVAYRVRASFLPGRHATVEQRLADLAMHKMDITDGGVLERGCVYIVPLMESLSLRHRMSAMGNPKSSTGRLDIFTRLITDYGTEFDRVREQYKGPLYAEVSPRTFSVLVRKGSRLSQIRIRRGSPLSTDESMRRLQQEYQLVGSSISEEDIRNGLPVAVDVRGEQTDGLIGYRAKSHTGRVPPTHAAEMIAYDTLVGEFRVHYAGFFDPGFGDPATGGDGSRAVLEVRSYEVPFVIEHGQIVGRLTYERLTAQPHRLYGAAGVNSSYQRQGIALSKHFRSGDSR